MLAKLRPTLRQVFGISLLGLLLGLAALFYLVLNASQQTILQSADRYRRLASRVVAQQVTTYLGEAQLAVDHFELRVHYGLIDPKNIGSLEHGLLSSLLANQNISEATLTYADSRCFGPNAHGQPDPHFSGQVAVLRAEDGKFVRRLTWYNGHQFVSASDVVNADSATQLIPTQNPIPAIDPTDHPTFQVAANESYGKLISTDLHWSQIDESLPESKRRVEVSVQKTIENSQGEFEGVLRVGLMKSEIDAAVHQRITREGEPDQHLIFLCDEQGRLITGFGDDKNHIIVSGDDLRIAPEDVPPVITRALQEGIVQETGTDMAFSSFLFQGKVYLCTFRFLPGTQDWIVGVVVPRDFYLGNLVQIRQHVLWTSLGLIGIIVLVGGMIGRSAVRSQSLILRETSRMNSFEFSAAKNPSFFRDVEEVLLSLEKAKTAMRAMSKYVPVDLVRRLYHDGREPVLGGTSAELSVLFTDIKEFTTFAEKIAPGELARLLGLYLQVMATVIQEEKGTVDKYIGDAVMAFWNAPERVTHHEIFACRAALRCQGGLRELYNSTPWGSAPRFETRFGLHRCVASVGHFGAPDRFNYTAIGDGINLASRLEGLNKHYGTAIIASESIQSAAKDQFEFRLLDRVAVKGKSEGVTIYELIAERIADKPRPGFITRYEEAFAAYQRCDFADALKLLEQQKDDPPSQVLAKRCQTFLANRPAAPWTGIYVFDSK